MYKPDVCYVGDRQFEPASIVHKPKSRKAKTLNPRPDRAAPPLIDHSFKV